MLLIRIWMRSAFTNTWSSRPIRAWVSGSDIDRVQFFEEHGELRARMRVNLVGLFGGGSPLPAFYSEQALGDSEDGNPTRDFLDLFNNRLQRLLLPIWQKYRYRSSFQSGAMDAFSAHLFALIGLGSEQIRQAQELNWKRLLPTSACSACAPIRRR